MKIQRTMRILSILVTLLFVSGLFSLSAANKTKADWRYPHIVDYEFVKPHAKIPASKNVLVVDSRPKRAKYDKGHIPNAISIPDSKFKKMTDLLPKNKSDLLIFYCGGLKCKLSHKSAYKAEKLGYKNVKVYAAGFPDWMKKKGSYASVSVDYMKKQVKKNADMVVVDSRPKRTKYDKGHLPGAISIPDSKFKKMTHLLPEDKNKALVFYCGGFHCRLSHKSASKAIDLGYTNVKVFAAGYPAWKKAVGATATTIKAGAEEGSIDIANFKQIIQKDPKSIMLIDVRDADEYAAGKFPTAVNIPTDDLEGKISSLPSDKPIVFVCSTGARSGEAFYMVQDLRPELKNVFYLEAEVTYETDNTFQIVAVQ